jgi:hypothetical protein
VGAVGRKAFPGQLLDPFEFVFPPAIVVLSVCHCHFSVRIITSAVNELAIPRGSEHRPGGAGAARKAPTYVMTEKSEK